MSQELSDRHKKIIIGGLTLSIVAIVVGTFLLSLEEPATPETYSVSNLDICETSYSLGTPQIKSNPQPKIRYRFRRINSRSYITPFLSIR